MIFAIIALHFNEAALQGSDIVHVEFDLGGLETKSGAGTIVIAVHSSWAPIGAKRFLELVKLNHFSGCKFFRVIENFMAQVGIPPLPEKSWDKKPIKDDPSAGRSNRRGIVTFATAGPNTRSQQIFFLLLSTGTSIKICKRRQRHRKVILNVEISFLVQQ